MTVYSFFHNSINGDRVYEAGDFAELTKATISDGIVEDLKVNYNGAYAYSINPGKAVVMGRLVVNDAIISTSLNTPTSGQTYSVVVRMDLTTRAASIETILGTTYQNDNAVKEFPIATMVVGTNTLTVTDVRKFSYFKSNKILLKDSKLVYNNGTTFFDAINFKEGSESSGMGIAIGAGGTTFIGGGESAYLTMLSSLFPDLSQERMIVTSDYEISFLTGMQDVPNTPTTGKRTTIATNGDLQIGANNVNNLFGVLRYNQTTRVLEILHWDGSNTLETTTLNVGDIAYQNTPWLNLSLASGISDYTTGNNAKYKRKGGIVYIKGSVKGITALDKVIATLPVGYRPIGSAHSFTAPTSGKDHARWIINTDGTIQLENVTQTTLPLAADWFPIHTCFPID